MLSAFLRDTVIGLAVGTALLAMSIIYSSATHSRWGAPQVVACIASEHVIPGITIERVNPRASQQAVLAIAAPNGVLPRAAGNRVISGST